MIKIKIPIIFMIKIKKDVATEIDWNVLEKCWVDRYEEDYEYYFTVMSGNDTTYHRLF